MLEEQAMKSKPNNPFASGFLSRACAIALCCGLGVFGSAVSSVAQTKAKAAGTPTVKQKRFATSVEAASALIQAAEPFDVLTLVQILGQGGSDLVVTEDQVQDKQRATMFAEKAREKTQVTPDPKRPGRAVLSVGNEEWPYPVPIVKGPGGWFFDTREGRKEILARRIGANELDALAICRGYVEVQKEYALQARDGVHQYAQRIISTPGKQDGLAWQNEDGSWGGPIWRRDSQSPGARVFQQDRTLPWLLLQDLERTGTRSTAWQNEFSGEGGDDRRVCTCGRAGRIPSHRCEDFYRQLHRNCP